MADHDGPSLISHSGAAPTSKHHQPLVSDQIPNFYVLKDIVFACHALTLPIGLSPLSLSLCPCAGYGGEATERVLHGTCNGRGCAGRPGAALHVYKQEPLQACGEHFPAIPCIDLVSSACSVAAVEAMLAATMSIHPNSSLLVRQQTLGLFVLELPVSFRVPLRTRTYVNAVETPGKTCEVFGSWANWLTPLLSPAAG